VIPGEITASYMESTETTTKSEKNELAKLGRQVAHDLNNPIGAISTSIYLIQDFLDTAGEGKVAASELKPFADSIREECETLRQIVEDFAKYATLDGLLLMPLDLREFIAKRVEDMNRTGVPAFFEDSQQPQVIEADASNLQFALRTLVDFAIASRATRVDVSLVQDERTKIVVRDNRPQPLQGESAEEVFNIGPSRGGGRLGLRLPLTKRIAELHGGSIEISVDGEFTQIVLLLPSRQNV
jgi:signal transduction histidine kinase